MQNPFRVAVRLRAAQEDQVAGGPECRAVVAGRHRPIVWITGVLAVDDFGHAPERRHDLLVVDDAMQQPVGNVLAGNAQGGTIFHQADVVDIRHLRAADALAPYGCHAVNGGLVSETGNVGGADESGRGWVCPASASFPGNGISPRRDRWPKIGSRPKNVSAETKTPTSKPANCGPLASFWE